MKQLYYLLILLYIWVLTACQSSQNPPVEAWPFQAQPDGSWGLISTEGNVIVPAGTYPYCPTSLVQGLFAVPDSTGFFTLYHQDQPTLPITHRRFSAIGHFYEDVAPAQELPGSPLLLIDQQGNTRFSSDTDSPYPIACLHNFSEGRALAITPQGEYGYLDTEGKWIIPPLYQLAYHFHEGVALVGTSNTQGQMGYRVIDQYGKQVMAIQHHSVWIDKEFHNGLLRIKHLLTQQYSYLDKEGKDAFYLPHNVTDATPFCYNMAAVRTSQGWGVIDRKGHFILSPHYQQIRLIAPKRVWVQKEGKWALYTDRGKSLTDFVYESPEAYMAQKWGVAHVKTNETGLGEEPACFYRKPLNPQKLTAAKTTVHSEAIETPSVSKPSSLQNTSSGRKKTITTLSDRDWQRVSRKNPFYQEAQKLLSGKLQESDAKRRRMILNYVEHFRTAYTTKDIDFLEQVFSERALIIVGKVIKSAQQPEGQFLSPQQVVYQVKSKRQYLNRLKQVFQANQKIRLTFSDFQIMRHPTHPSIYGVSLHQGYSSDLYADDGYLFLLWDFSDETAPKIHVRTWQPSMLNEHTPLPKEEIFNIRHFNLN